MEGKENGEKGNGRERDIKGKLFHCEKRLCLLIVCFVSWVKPFSLTVRLFFSPAFCLLLDDFFFYHEVKMLFTIYK